MKKYYLLLILLTVSLQVYCKTIRGEVVDSLGHPVPFSTIVVDHSQKIGTTNKYGRFVLENVSSDKCRLTVSNIGYETKHIIVPQGDDDLFLQISLKEQVVQLADVDVVYGDITSLILKKMENVKMLREQLPTFEAVAECQITSIGNLKEFPSDFRSLLRSFLALAGYKKIFQSMERNPDLTLTIRKDIRFNKGNYTMGKGELVSCSGNISEEEKTSFLKKKWGFKENLYDFIYNTLRHQAKRKAKQNKNGTTTDILSYSGTYKENDKTIHILKSPNMEYHIVADSWQVYRMSFQDKATRSIIECHEYQRGIYLPVFSHNESIYELDATHVWKLADTTVYKYK